MAKKQEPGKSDTTKVAPRYVIAAAEVKAMKAMNQFDRLNDTIKAKNIANIEELRTLIQRNAERAREGLKPLPKPEPTLYAKDLPKKKK